VTEATVRILRAAEGTVTASWPLRAVGGRAGA
jgi:hypothetical protein